MHVLLQYRNATVEVSVWENLPVREENFSTSNPERDRERERERERERKRERERERERESEVSKKRRKDLKVREGGSKKVNECKQERGKQK